VSDFTSVFWEYYIAIISVVSMLACGWLLMWQRTRPKTGRDGVTGADARTDNTTGHVWDGDLIELNNPLPRWWMWLFYITIVFGLVYFVLYPGSAIHGGILGWTSLQEYRDETKAADVKYGPLYEQFAKSDFKAIAADAQGRGAGERLFLNHCAQCHGSDARGSKGFPNLTDNDWQYGGEPETILKGILEGHNGLMPPMAAAVGSADDVRNVANYVLSLSGSGHDSLRAALGKDKFATCVACHGADGKGNTALGAPNLTDKVWLYGGGVDSIIHAITNGRNGVMPPHKDILDPAKARVVAAYVWSLSNNVGP